jgi:organic radical activating enzyme
MELPATIEYRDDGSAYIVKTCPTHGYEEAMVERDYKFWDTALQTDPTNDTWNAYNDITIIEVTDRCNVQCKHCYHSPDNEIEDLPAELIIARALAVPTSTVCFMGAEPTMRKDLPYIIKEICNRPAAVPKTKVMMYTNGLKIRDKEYLQSLVDSGLNLISMSIHNPEYHNAAVWKKVDQALQNIAESSIMIAQLSFTVESKQQVRYAVEKMIWLKSQGRLPYNFCVRSPSQIGIPFEQDKEIFASEIYDWLTEVANELGLSFGKHSNIGSNPYHIGVVLDNNIIIQIIHWATAKSLDTSYMYMGPYAQFIPHTFGTFLLQAILRDGWKKGWWQGQRLTNANTKEIKFMPQ